MFAIPPLPNAWFSNPRHPDSNPKTIRKSNLEINVKSLTPGHFTPTAPDGLNHHGEERDALGGALGAGILMAALQVLIPAGNSINDSGVSVQPQAEATGDG